MPFIMRNKLLNFITERKKRMKFIKEGEINLLAILKSNEFPPR